jgi:DNA-binding transcriptional MerR regulator
MDLPARQRPTVPVVNGETCGTTRLTVGEMARAVGMTTKALRHYDQLGLFRPDGVDDGNGYRWYAAERVPQARLITRLRTVGLPLEAVAECLGSGGDPDVVDRVLEQHRRRLQSRLTRVRGDLHRLAHLIKDGTEVAMDESTGAELPDTPPVHEGPAVADERKLAAELFNGVWALMETEDRTRAQDDRMLHMAHASRHHWEQVGTPANLARGEWLCSRVYAVLGRAEPALHHATRVLEICEEHGIGDWDLAFAYEALARAHAVAGDPEATEAALARARAAADDIAEAEDRDLLLSDLATISG